MRAAIPTFGERVSPRFDCAAKFLVVTLAQDGVAAREEFNAADWTPPQRIKHLVDLGVDVVVCGGIDRRSADSLMNLGIKVYGWVCGTVEESVDALQRGELRLGAGVDDVRCCRARRRGRHRGEL